MSRVSPLQVIGEELPKWWNADESEGLRETVKAAIGLTPLGILQAESPSDVGLSLLGAPGNALKKLGALAVASGYAPDAEAGLFTRVPPEIAKQFRKLAAVARRSSPNAEVEFAASDLTPLMRGAKNTVPNPPSSLENGYNVHSHGVLQSFLPSSYDMKTWQKLPQNVKTGVVRVAPKGTQSIMLDMKGKEFPTYNELLRAKKKAESLKPGIDEALDIPSDVELNSAKLQWIIDQALADNIDAYFGNVRIPKELTGGVQYSPGSHYRAQQGPLGLVSTPEVRAFYDK